MLNTFFNNFCSAFLHTKMCKKIVQISISSIFMLLNPHIVFYLIIPLTLGSTSFHWDEVGSKSSTRPVFQYSRRHGFATMSSVSSMGVSVEMTRREVNP